MRAFKEYLMLFTILINSQKNEYMLVLTSPTFTISMQQSGKAVTTDEWAMYNDKIHQITKEFTICHWDKLQYFTDNINTLWSYCYVHDENSTLFCLEMDYSLIPSKANRHTILNAWIGKSVMSGEIVPFNHRKWNHACWTYSTASGYSRIYYNGEILVSIQMIPDENVTVLEGFKDATDAAFVIGQQQDKVRGGYNTNQLYIGEIGELNMWDHVLNIDDVIELSKCKHISKGNIVSWDLQKWKVNGAKINKISRHNSFCGNTKTLVIFPQHQPLHMSKSLCSIHGGKIVTPTSQKENEQVIVKGTF